MDLSFHINNKEDIIYLNQFNNDQNKLNHILQSALSIGLKSIQMSETNLNCQSYLKPIQELHTITNHNIENIHEKLNSFLHLQSNSSSKGELSENICRKLLAKKYPEWEFNDVSHENYSGDCRATQSSIGEILYEFKNYDTNVNREQVSKFHRDLEYTGIKYGIFVSNTSGIVGKKNIEWEIIHNNTIVVYVSNIGYNGYGCIIGTELLLALVNINIIDTSKMNYYFNYEIDSLKENLTQLTHNYKQNLENITKHKYLIKEQKNKINQSLELLEKSIFEIELQQSSIFKEIFDTIHSLKNDKIELRKLSGLSELNDFDPLLQKCSSIFSFSNYTISIHDNNIYYHKNDVIFAYTNQMKTKILLIFPITDPTISINLKYEKIRKNEIIIELKDNSLLFDFINEKIKKK